jgi:hypothetical protein
MNDEQMIQIPWSNKPADSDGWYLYVRFNTSQWRAVLVNQGFYLNNQDPEQYYAFGVPVMEFEPGFWCGPFVNPHTLYTSQTLTWERPTEDSPNRKPAADLQERDNKRVNDTRTKAA